MDSPDDQTPPKPIGRYAVFGYDTYYPAGGWGDFREAFATEEAAAAYVRVNYGECEYLDIIDLATGTEIEVADPRWVDTPNRVPHHEQQDEKAPRDAPDEVRYRHFDPAGAGLQAPRWKPGRAPAAPTPETRP